MIKPRAIFFGVLIVLSISPSLIAGGSKPIVDIRFDAPYMQITNSNGDEWAPTWADDGNLYSGNDDGDNFGGIPGRSVAFGKITGDDPAHLTGKTLSDMGGYGDTDLKSDHANWKTMNSYCVDGVIYMFITRCQYPEQSGDPKNRHVFKNSCLIKSTDHGLSWESSSTHSFHYPTFPGLRFGSPYFVWYGKDGAASVDNADKYIYAVANNGHFEDGDNYILGRVSRKKLPAMNGADWQFYHGGDGLKNGHWVADMEQAKPILEDPMNCSMTGMTYIPGLGRYVMVVWHYVAYDLRKDPHTINDFYEASKPWGPWTKFKSINAGDLAWYVPIVSQKFQTAVDDNTVKCILFPTGNYMNRSLYKLNFIPITLSTAPLTKN